MEYCKYDATEVTYFIQNAFIRPIKINYVILLVSLTTLSQ
jgi:hypothetical protein